MLSYYRMALPIISLGIGVSTQSIDLVKCILDGFRTTCPTELLCQEELAEAIQHQLDIAEILYEEVGHGASIEDGNAWC